MENFVEQLTSVEENNRITKFHKMLENDKMTSKRSEYLKKVKPDYDQLKLPTAKERRQSYLNKNARFQTLGIGTDEVLLQEKCGRSSKLSQTKNQEEG